MCTESVQLKVGLINKSLMGVHALYRNICHLQQYSTAKHLVRANCVHKSQQKRCNSLKFAQIQECALLSVQLYKGDSSLNVYGTSTVCVGFGSCSPLIEELMGRTAWGDPGNSLGLVLGDTDGLAMV